MIALSQVKISVIMPVYNEESFLRESLESFFAQSIASECEIICVDDGSQDSSLEILKEYLFRHKDNMQLLRQANSGSGKARNYAMEHAKGEFVAFLDADDIYPSPVVLEHLYDAAMANGVNVAGGSLIIFDEHVENTEFADVEGFSGHQFLEAGLRTYDSYQFDYGYQRFIYKLGLLNDSHIRFKDYLRYQDPPFFVETMITAGTFYSLVEPTYRYRASSKPVSWTSRKACDMIKAITDVGLLAARNDFEALFRLNLMRLNQDWRSTLSDLVIAKGDFDVLYALFEAKRALLGAASNLDLEQLLDGTPSVFADVKTSFERSLKYKEKVLELDNLNKDVECLQKRLADLGNECESTRSLANILQDRIEELTSSTTWKTGSAVTWLPRKIKSEALKRIRSE